MESNIPTVDGDEPVLPASDATAPHVEDNPSTDDISQVVSELDATPPDVSEYADSTAPADASEATSASTMQTLLDEQQDGPHLKKGDLLEGTIVHTSPTEILIDVGMKSEGVISGKELERIDRETLSQLKVGEKVLVYVLNPEDRNGHIILSLSRAQEEQDWRNAESMHAEGDIYQGKIDGYNKGGLIVRFGRVRGFIPESQVSRDRRKRAEGSDPAEKWAKMRGEDVAVKILEVDRARNRLILSEREALPSMREGQKQRLLDELQVGDRRTGRVKSLSDFGAFVDVGGADGLVHLTEMSWKHITNPREVLKEGQEVPVEVISIDRERKRIGLSIKRTEEDPWLAIARQYSVGQLVQGTITKLTKFGAFARLVDNPEIEGLIHISELAGHRVQHPKEVVSEGEICTLRIVKVDTENRRMGLSIKRVDSPEYLEADYKRAMGPSQRDLDMADLEAAQLREEDRRRDRKKGNNKKGGRKGRSEYEDFDEEYDG